MKNLFLLMAAVMSAPLVQAEEVIVNGGFESGDLSGWEANEKGGSIIFVESGTISPATAYDTAGPATGSFYALADGPLGATSLIQKFTIAPVADAILKFDMFINSGAFGQVHAAGLDQETGGSFEPNQHVRVDLLSGAADAFDTGAGVLASFYTGQFSPVNLTNPYTHNEIDVTDILASGGTYQLRFGQVNNQDYLLQGIDNVSLNVTPVPEADTYAMLLAGLGLVGYAARRRQSAQKKSGALA